VKLKVVLLLAALCSQVGCALSPRSMPDMPSSLLDDALFEHPAEPVDTSDVFALSPAMRQYLDQQILPRANHGQAKRALIDALYAQGRLKLEYDATRTRTAAEAFEARAGNCLSLLIMTGAFAQAMGLNVHFQSVLAEEAWERSDELHFFVGHVNIRLGAKPSRLPFPGPDEDWMVVDFLPGQDLQRQRTREIDRARVLAMFANNRAAEALSRGDLDQAYAWLREAVRSDPAFLSAYNTLGVVYLRRGALPQAEAALRLVLAAEPGNPHALDNLATVVQQAGRAAEADALRAQLRRVQPQSPFAWFREGQQAMREGDYRRARRLFEREIARAPDYHEFHFWLALAHLQLGETGAAQMELERALAASTTREQQGLYSAKLRRLKGSL
jgi:tetratricopeptide (TPR) repeat protein